MKRFGFLAIALMAVAIILSGKTVHAVDPLGQVTLYNVPASLKNPLMIAQGSDGNIWYVRDSSATNTIVRYTPSTASFTSWSSTNSASHIISDSDGGAWYVAGFKFGHINSQGQQTEYSLPKETRSGRTVDYEGCFITIGPDGKIWVAIRTSDGDMKMLKYTQSGVINPNSTVTFQPLWSPFGSSNYDLISDSAVDSSKSRIWYAYRDHLSHNSVLGYVDTLGNSHNYVLPSPVSDNITGLAYNTDGKVWYSTNDYYGYVDANGTASQVYSLGANSYSQRLRFGFDGRLWGTQTAQRRLVGINTSDFQNPFYSQQFTGNGEFGSGPMPYGLTAGSDGNMWFTLYANQQIGKIGTGDAGTADSDHDGLSVAKEVQQGTSDQSVDSDHDGLSDYIESQWYPTRDATFCGQSSCAYPHPMQKDVYIETDWMVRPSDGLSFQPSQQQLNYIQTAFANRGINVVFDTGNFGGGNQVPYNSEVRFDQVLISGIDFYDYKRGGNGITASFNINKKYKIWHYMLLGDTFAYPDDQGHLVTTAGGISYASDDDSMIAYGYIHDNPGGFMQDTFDKGISAVIMHELGHNLCLTADSSSSPGCQSNLVDNPSAPLSYISVMNYHYVWTVSPITIDYSSGPTSDGVDHDDWTAVEANMGDFSKASNQQGDNLRILPSTQPRSKVQVTIPRNVW